jgi:hypothetical protein
MFTSFEGSLRRSQKAMEKLHVNYSLAVQLMSPANKAAFPNSTTGTPWSDGTYCRIPVSKRRGYTNLKTKAVAPHATEELRGEKT